MSGFYKKEIEETLLQIDLEATLLLKNDSVKYPVVIVGGSAFLLSDLTDRPTTHDVDVLSAHKDLAEIIKRYHLLNSSVMAFMDSIPYNFEDRLRSLNLPTKSIEYLVPSLEDLAVMKLYAWRANDVVDLTSKATLDSIDWQLLERLVYDPDEARASTLVDRRYNDMVVNFEEYKKVYHG